ncbi:hypothetical protein O6H91_Y564500 [Diphasiastrum complanatum]|nr:hypothetical protein O6H91_Y564500 [Diphasiastrum complanatum]
MVREMALRSRFLVLTTALLLLLLLESSLIMKMVDAKKVHVPDNLDDVVDDEEDEEWKAWGKPKPKEPPPFDPPPDLSEMQPQQIQAEMLKRHFGPSMGFVKLRLDVPRTKEETPRIAKKWTNILRTGAISAKFVVVDVNTIMFSIEDGQDTVEVCLSFSFCDNTQVFLEFNYITSYSILDYFTLFFE